MLNLTIFYCQIYTIGLNISFTTYLKFSPVSYKYRSETMTDNRCINIYNIEKNDYNK